MPIHRRSLPPSDKSTIYQIGGLKPLVDQLVTAGVKLMDDLRESLEEIQRPLTNF